MTADCLCMLAKCGIRQTQAHFANGRLGINPKRTFQEINRLTSLPLLVGYYSEQMNRIKVFWRSRKQPTVNRRGFNQTVGAMKSHRLLQNFLHLGGRHFSLLTAPQGETLGPSPVQNNC